MKGQCTDLSCTEPATRVPRRFRASRELRGRAGRESSNDRCSRSATQPAGGKSLRIASTAARLTSWTSSTGAVNAVTGAASSGAADQARRPQVVQQNGRLAETIRSHNSYHLTCERCRQTPWHRLQLHVVFITSLSLTAVDGSMLDGARALPLNRAVPQR